MELYNMEKEWAGSQIPHIYIHFPFAYIHILNVCLSFFTSFFSWTEKVIHTNMYNQVGYLLFTPYILIVFFLIMQLGLL